MDNPWKSKCAAKLRNRFVMWGQTNEDQKSSKKFVKK
jgi:hypothetical protein